MNLRSAFITAAALLVLSAPAWGDSVKFKSAGSYDNVQFWGGSNQFNHSDIKFLVGFKAGDPKNKDSFTFKDGHFVLVMPSGWSWNGGHNSDSSSGTGSGAGKVPVGTPEPASFALLLVGLIGLGAFVYRRNPSFSPSAS